MNSPCFKEYKLHLTCDGKEVICPTTFLAASNFEAVEESIVRLEQVVKAVEYISDVQVSRCAS